MTNQLISTIATDRQHEIAVSAERRRSLMATVAARISRRSRPASGVSGMLPMWRHESPARGS